MRNEKDDKMRKEDVSWTLTHPLFYFSFLISNFSLKITLR